MLPIMKDREVILEVLGRLARRLWINHALQEIGFGLSLVLFSLVAFGLVRPTLSAGGQGALSTATIALTVAGCAAYALWRAGRRATLAQAAGAADRCEQLKDELKTAYWLVAQGKASSFEELQVERAARTALRLDPRRIAPAQPPPGLWVAGALALLLAVTSSLAPRLSLSWDWLQPAAAESPVSLRALLEGAPDDEGLQKLDKALATLEKPDTSREQLERAVAQAREAVDEVNLRALAARESLSGAAAAMRGRAELDEVAQSLEQGRTQEAIALLRALASAQDRSGEDASRARAADRNDVDADSTKEDVGPDFRRQGTRVNEDALSKVIRNIEAAQGVLDTQRRAAEVRRRMEDFLVATSQRSALTASQFGNRASTPNPTPAPESGNADLRGGTMYRQGAVARGDSDDSQEGSKTGAASGHSEALELEGARSERLDSKLRLETLRAQAAAGDHEREEQSTWYYQSTQGGEASTSFQQVRGRERFANAEAMSTERVPLHSRQSVRNYFINLHESATK